MPKSSAQRTKEYRERIRALNPHKTQKTLAKSSTQRVREWRAKRRSMKNCPQSDLLSTKPSTSGGECSTELLTSQDAPAPSWAPEYFTDTSVVKQESAGDNDNDDSSPRHEVKQEFVEIELTPVDGQACAHATSTSEKVDQDISIKDDTGMDIGPTVLQPMDSCHRTNQENIIVGKNDTAIAFGRNNPVACSVVKEECVEDNCGGVDAQQCDQATSAQVGVHVAFNGVDRGIFIKLQGTQLVIVPTVLQQRNNQSTSVVKAENTHEGNDPVLYSKVKEDSVQDKVVAITGAQLHHNVTPSEQRVHFAFTSNYTSSQYYSQSHLAEPHDYNECNEESRFYECAVCEKTYKSKDDLRHHARIHQRFRPTDAEPKIFICHYCEKKFTSKLAIKDHITCVHGSGSYKCNLCDKAFGCEKYLKTHKVSMHFSRMQECNVCGKLLRRSNLKNHMFNMHSGKKLQCKVCGEIVMSKHNLHFHLNSVHGQQSTDSPILNRCEYCQKIYPGKKNLNAHLKYVHGPRCSECKACFISEARLQRHVASVHTNEEHGAIMPKSSTERVRAYREKQRAQRPPKKPPKSGLQRAREYRARQKALKSVVSVLASVDANHLPTIDNQDTTAELAISKDVSSAEPNSTVA